MGATSLLFGKATQQRYKYNLIQLDKKLNEMLKDVDMKGEKSEYYEVIDRNKKTQFMQDFIKKNKKAHIVFYIFGGMLIFISFFTLF